jgi:catechol 2,3-dioxygenase-like lactoylglutathione lyase family enzyme
MCMGRVASEAVGIAVRDLEATIDFFTDLGLTGPGRDTISGDWTDTADVALVVRCGRRHHATETSWAQTTQIAPTILALLGLDPNAQQAVRIHHPAVLPHPNWAALRRSWPSG